MGHSKYYNLNVNISDHIIENVTSTMEGRNELKKGNKKISTNKTMKIHLKNESNKLATQGGMSFKYNMPTGNKKGKKIIAEKMIYGLKSSEDGSDAICA